MNEHQTPLLQHFREKHFWKDVFFLMMLCSFVVFLNTNNPFVLLFKLMAIVASLEFISFLSFHLIGKEKSLLLQGFLGGMISSTTVFLQLNYDKKFSDTDSNVLARSELLAICAMILECIIIMLVFPGDLPFKFILPFVIYLLVITVSIFFLKLKANKNLNTTQPTAQSLEIDDPIRWVNVLKFALYVTVLKYFLNFSNHFLYLPKKLSIFIASIFEAHAVLAVSISGLSNNLDEREILTIVILILAGSSISKMYFVLTGSVLKSKRLVMVPMMISFLLASLALYL